MSIENKKNISKVVKREIILTIISVVVLVSFFSLFTYAFFMDIKETDVNVLNYGDLTLEFCVNASCDSNIENIGRTIGTDENGDPVSMYPQSELEALENVPYIFKVTNTGDYKQTIKIKLMKKENPELHGNYSDYRELDLQYLNLSFSELGLEVQTMPYQEFDGILDTIVLEPNEERIYNLWLWIKEDAPNSIQGSYFIADISLTGEYEVEGFTLYEKILLDNNEQSDINIDFANNSEQDRTKGLYYTADETVATYGEDGERIYYFRGDVDNNWVSFAGYKWRIVRTTSEGGVKLVYSGDGLTDSSAFIAKAEAGYPSYINNAVSPDGRESEIKEVIDAWYRGGITTHLVCFSDTLGINVNCDFTGLTTKLSDYSSFLSETAIYCNDSNYREVKVEEPKPALFKYYGAYDRIHSGRPTFECPSANDSRYTVNENTGNGYLTYPIAILSMDEIYYAGVVTTYFIDNASGYWWTMSPASAEWGFQNVYSYNNGLSSIEYQSSNIFVRPSTSLKSCVTVVGNGNGEFDTPYELSDSKC